MFCCDVKWGLNRYLRPLFDDVCEQTMYFRSASTSQVVMPRETLCQSASSIVLYLHRRLSSSAAVNYFFGEPLAHLISAVRLPLNLWLTELSLTPYHAVNLASSLYFSFPVQLSVYMTLFASYVFRV